MFPFQGMVLELSKKVHFMQFCADLSQKPVKVCESNFPYVHLKVLITLFQKMVWFKGVWATVQELLAIKILKKMLA